MEEGGNSRGTAYLLARRAWFRHAQTRSSSQYLDRPLSRLARGSRTAEALRHLRRSLSRYLLKNVLPDFRRSADNLRHIPKTALLSWRPMHLHCSVRSISGSFFSRATAHIFSLLCLAAIATCLNVFATAQLNDDVHIVPRPESHKSVDSGLEGSADRLRIDVEMVLVPVTVTDVKNHPVVDLAKKNFKLFEGENEKTIQYFNTEDAPLSVGILIDLSSSMANKIDAVREAADEFLNNANPQDDYFVITFADKPKLLANTTQSFEDIHAALGAAKPKGNTALADALYMGLAKLKSAKYSRRALLVISDGGDNNSRHS